jgi:hypothetical protein
MLKTISTAFAWAGVLLATTTTVWAGTQSPPPTVDNDSGGEGILLLVLLGAVIFAVAKGKSKPVEEGAPEIIDAEDGAGTGKY